MTAERGKGGTKTRLKHHFSHCSFSIKKKKKEESKKERKKERTEQKRKEKKRKEKKRKEKKRKRKRKKHSTFFDKSS